MRTVNGTTCPRCLGGIPSTERLGDYPGALSRADNQTEVCSACGMHEAMSVVVPPHLWPILTETTPPEALADRRVIPLNLIR